MYSNVDMKKIDEKLNSMTTEQKLGHLVVCRAFPGVIENEKEYLYDKLKRGCIGVLQAPMDKKYEYFPFEVREINPDILVCSDMESGFPRSKRRLPPALAITAAALGDESIAYEFGRITAIEAKAAGFNMVWGPMVDLIGLNQKEMVQRKLNNDPYVIIKMAEAIARGYRDEGMFYTVKHCPGGNDTYHDSHLYGDNISQKTEKGLLELDLISYKKMVEDNLAPGIMSNHKMFPNIDPDYPPTLSKKIVGLIRSLGFDGVLTTDSLGMVGLINKYGEDACIAQSIAAGHDMIIPNYRITYRETMERLERAYENGAFDENRLNEAVRRVLIAQQMAKKPASQNSLSEKELKVLEKLNSDSIFAVTDEGVSPAISKDKTHLFVVLTENLYKNAEGEAVEVEPVESWNPDEMSETLLKEFPGSKTIFVSEYPSRWHMHDVSYYATHYDDVVFLTFCKGVPYGAHDCLTLRLTRLMDALQKRISAIVHIGNPYAMEQVPHVPRLIVGFSGGECEKYALEILCGKREAKGTCPVVLNLQ